MSARDKNTPNLRIPLDPNHSTATSKNASFFQNHNMSLPKNDRINGYPNVPHHNHIKNSRSNNTTSPLQDTATLTSLQQHKRARNILSLRQPHQPIDPTPLRQHITNISIRHTSEPVMSTTASSLMQNNKTASSSFRDSKPTPTFNTATQDPKDQTYNQNGTDPTTKDSKDQNDNSNNKAKTVIKTYTLGPRKYTFRPRRSDVPWIDPRYDPDLTLAERLEASTDFPLAPFSEYEWKVENDYVNLTSWQPPHRRSREWKGMGG
jgi:hypothetical protein